MARVTMGERRTILAAVSSLMRTWNRLHRVATLLEKSYKSNQDLGQNEMATAMQETLDDMAVVENDIATQLAAINFDYAIESEVGQETGFTSVAIDADTGASTATVTANGGLPFEAFSAADVVEILAAEDTENLGSFTLSAATGTLLTFNAVISGGVDNTADTEFRVVLRTR